MYDDQKHLLSICWYHVRLKHLPAMRETQVRSLGWEDPLEKTMATHSSTLAWKIPWTKEPGRLQSMGPQRVGHNWVTSLSLSAHFLCAVGQITYLSLILFIGQKWVSNHPVLARCKMTTHSRCFLNTIPHTQPLLPLCFLTADLIYLETFQNS